jgi:hypothetical protein
MVTTVTDGYLSQLKILRLKREENYETFFATPGQGRLTPESTSYKSLDRNTWSEKIQ